MAGLPLVGLAVGAQAVGTGISAIGQMRAGRAAQEDAEFQAEQEVRTGREEFAASQREAMEARREGRLARSRGQAVAAASGAGAGSDAPTIVNLLGDITRRSEYSAQSRLYGGESRRAGAFDQAQATLRSGRARRRGANLSAMGSIFSGIGGAFNTYNEIG